MDWISDPLDRLQWALWHFLSTIFWAVDRLVLIGAVLIHSLRKWITNPNGVIDLVTSSMLQGEQAVSLKTFIAGAILLALLLAAFIFILRPLIGSEHSPVDLRKVFLWLVFAGYLFSTGGTFFTSLEGFRAQLSSSAYQVAASVNGSVGETGYNNTQGEVPLNSSEPFSPTIELFPSTTHMYQGAHEYTGIDVTGAYMFATQEDINGTNNGGTGLPAGFESQYFTNDGASPWPSNYNADQRQAALNRAVTGVIRMGTGIVPSIFAIQQAIIFLALALAAAILIFSLPIALVFAFFTATEIITLSVLRAYISLLVKTYVTAMILAIFMGFLKFWADSQNWVAFLGMSLLIMYFTFQLAHMAVQTITQSLNVVTQAIGQATGTGAIYFDPIKMAAQGAGLAAVVGLAAATGGAGLAAGSLISGTGGMGVPGMQTLGFGLALRSRRPGQLASRTLEQSSQAASPENAGVTTSPASGSQRANDHLQSLGIPPIQQTSLAPSGASEQPLATPTAPAQGNAPRLASLTAVSEVLAHTVPGMNGSQPEQTGKTNGQTDTGVSVMTTEAQASTAAPVGVKSDKPDQAVNQVFMPQEQAELPASSIRVRPVKSRDASIAPVLADIVRGRQSGDLPEAFQNLPRTAQKALSSLVEQGYRPGEVAAIADAARTVAGVMQYRNVPPASIPKYFLGPDGAIDVQSKGVRDTLEQAGLPNWAQAGDARRSSDLAYIVGAGLQLERTYNASEISAVIGQAVADGGTADSAADLLEVSPSAAWGGRYGSVQSVITRSQAFGLTTLADVQSFIGIAHKHSPEDLTSGHIKGLTGEQQALVGRVRARAAELASTERGDSTSVGHAALQRYLRDVRNVPTRMTAIVVPVVPIKSQDSATEEGTKS